MLLVRELAACVRGICFVLTLFVFEAPGIMKPLKLAADSDFLSEDDNNSYVSVLLIYGLAETSLKESFDWEYCLSFLT